jgi:hypothetical protein
MAIDYGFCKRRLGITWQLLLTFLNAVFASDSLLSSGRRPLVFGKMRRLVLAAVPFLGEYLQNRYGLSGVCRNCGASCQILYACPFWDTQSSLCSVYEHRPRVCRLFPITPSDLRDRDAVALSGCGFSFCRPSSRLIELFPKPPLA